MSDRKRKIVVVDDDPEMNLAIQRLLSASGFSTVAFDSAAVFLEASPMISMACLILDIHLGEFSGFELFHRLRQYDLVTPVIFITAYDGPAVRAQAQNSGTIGYFTKPFVGKN